jgi:signal transduction histidine kinase
LKTGLPLQNDIHIKTRPTLSFYAHWLGVTVLYVAAAKAGLMYAIVGSTVTLLWAPSGIALTAILIYGWRMAFAVALGALLANSWTGLPFLAVCSIAAGNTLEALVGAWLLVRLANAQNFLETRRDVFALIALAAIFTTTLSASVGVTTLVWVGTVAFEDYSTVWLKWWLGDMMGVLVVAPLILSWRHLERAPSPQKVVEALCLIAALAVVSFKIFGAPELAVGGYYPASLALFPFVIWSALRFQQRGASLVTFVISLLAIWGTSQGTGPFVVESPVDSLMRWCAFAIVVAITGLLLAASVAEQRRAQTELKSSHAELEQRVEERTLDLASTNANLNREMDERRSLEIELIRVSEEQRRVIGCELHDGLGQHLTSLSLLSASLQQQLTNRAQPEASAARRIGELIDEATTMTRSVARGLYPVALEYGGLLAALEQLADHTRSLHKMDCILGDGSEVQLHDPLVAINLYRIAQEAITNALKYSQASLMRINLARIDGKVQLTLSDDGIGINTSRLASATGLGMHSMHYRASLIGGRMEIDSDAQQGTTITVTYPDLEGQSEQPSRA